VNLLNRIARRTGLGCHCCGHFGPAVLFRQRLPFKRDRYDLTWCSQCKFAACPVCKDG
jgi:hypothetical protein